METHNKETESRQATVMVAAISGLLTTSEAMDLAQVTQILNKSIEAIEPVIRLYDGTVERFAGERMTAFFGIPVSSQNFPQKAVGASLELRNRIEAMIAEQELPGDIGIRIGITTGAVIAGFVGKEAKRHYTVMGDTVELASRIQDLAEKGQILTGPETYRQTQKQFEYRSLEPLPLKGYKKPIQLYELLSKKKERQAIVMESARMIVSEMVGRDKELELLETQLMKLVINGKGCVVNIFDEAGIGKSRLIAELKKRMY
jgi:class 3 adenylate cyclase